ncbi:MAG: ABC transporter ATP-binding protein [Clostridia bacterium]|nr:ABC transporter ATP-binding protein [Clostridia bacterium]
MFQCELSVKYGSKQVFDSFKLTLNEGITMLFGKNGSGKTTLLHALTGAIACEGNLLLDGVELTSLTPLKRARYVSLLPQILPSPDLLVKDAVAMGRFPYGAPSAEDKSRIDEIMQTLGIACLSERVASSLSGGERQKVFLAMLLAQDTPVVLLDEPTTYMDISFRETFFSVLNQLKEKRKTVLFVTHDLTSANEADRVLLLDGGALAFDGTKDECFERNVLESAFSVRSYTVDNYRFFK